MIEVVHGDILNADAEALVNTVNCVGVMGRGIALQFRKKFPENFRHYKKACDAGELRPGSMLVEDMGRMFNPRYIINFPTKDHWRSGSRIEDIQSGLLALVDEVRNRRIKSIAVPPLGCGLGGLDWNVVKKMITEAFEDVEDVRVLLYEPNGAPPSEKMAKSPKVPRMTVGRAAMIGLMRQYLSAVMDPFVSLLEVHKLMYFLVAVGEPMNKLSFQKGHYGPYSENLRHVLNETEGYFTNGFADGEDNPEKPIELLNDGIEQAEKFLDSHPKTKAHFDRVADLIKGFETPYGMELLATVHWVHSREAADSPQNAARLIRAWSDRKKQLFHDSHVHVAWKALHDNGLLTGVQREDKHSSRLSPE